MNLLDKLKIKPIPKKKEQFNIKIVQPPTTTISITEDDNEVEKSRKTKIIDKTNDKLVDRVHFLSKINPLTALTSLSKIPDTISAKMLTGEQIVENEISAPIIPQKPIKIRKLKEKIKLDDRDIEQLKTDDVQISEKIKQTRRRTRKPISNVISEGPGTMIEIGDTLLQERLPKKEELVLIKSNAYYMNNRESFVNFTNALFRPYKDELKDSSSSISCDRPDNAKFQLLTHQKIVRDYLNLYTPYRGLLLYHGLGSGKTCSSIALAEGMKSDKQIIVMTPASLRTNYLEELKSCGDQMYKKNQFWEFIDTMKTPSLIDTLSSVLQLSSDYIRKHGGAWLVNVKKQPNFIELNAGDKKSIDLQINEMITYKYKFMNYNGLRNSHLKELTLNYSINPFDNKVIIIDEAHNFVSRIANKMKRPDSLSMKLYEYLLSATNTRIVFLTGTPIINYPNEIAILFNILRGYIKTWDFPLNIKTTQKMNKEEMVKIFEKLDILDYLEYKPSSKILTVTRNPYGFMNVNKYNTYKGVTNNKIASNIKVGKNGDLSDSEFEKMIASVLNKNQIEILVSGVRVENFKALPDTLESFQNFFINPNTGVVKNKGLFQRRILGLTSYFKSAQEQLMPKYDSLTDYHVVKIPMSDFQFGVYEQARIQERKIEVQNAKKQKKSKGNRNNIYEDSVSTYRIFSRAFCNFVFPENKRPMPKDGENMEDVLQEEVDEDLLDAVTVDEKINNPDGAHNADDIDIIQKNIENDSDVSYDTRIKDALRFLQDNAATYLSPIGLEVFSPKFLNVLENIQDEDHIGLHLIYSQFRTLEGIGILKLILEHNGYTQFKIKKENGNWILDIPSSERGKPTFALYTGTETVEEKEILRNVYNSTWNLVPETIVSSLRPISTNNFYGEIIKVFMITASGAEGISLKNTRYVHIIEPYWHPVRKQQVIGRARRICSHQDLPPELRTVSVFQYLMTFTNDQIEGDGSIELRLKDRSKLDKVTPLTSDEALFEISSIKEGISKQLLHSVIETSMDCSLHSSSGSKKDKTVKCFSFGKVSPYTYSYKPSISNEESDQVAQANKTSITWKAEEVTIPINGINTIFARNKQTNEIYDIDSYNDAIEFGGDPILIGRLEQTNGKYRFIKN